MVTHANKKNSRKRVNPRIRIRPGYSQVHIKDLGMLYRVYGCNGNKPPAVINTCFNGCLATVDQDWDAILGSGYDYIEAELAEARRALKDSGYSTGIIKRVFKILEQCIVHRYR